VCAEIAALSAIIIVGWDRQGGNAYRVGGHTHIEYPHVAQPLAAVGEVGLVGQHEQVALGQRQRRMRAAAAPSAGCPTPHDGMQPIVRTHSRTTVPGSKIGSISQATKVAQAVRDARH
jgi:hypothetical protein